MSNCKFTPAQIRDFIRQASYSSVQSVCCEHGISQGRFYHWRQSVSDVLGELDVYQRPSRHANTIDGDERAELDTLRSQLPRLETEVETLREVVLAQSVQLHVTA